VPSFAEAPSPQRNESINTEQTSTDYWTSERLRSAKPVRLPTLSETDLRMLKEGIQKKSQDEDIPPRDFRVYGSPSNADVSVFPYNNGGKLYRTLDGEDGYCSAQFVDPTVLLTAAHCIRNENTGAWATRVLFLRGYNDGVAQQSVVSVCLATKLGWVTGGASRWRWDYAFIKSSESTSGHFGLRIGMPHSTWEATGYPLNYGAGQRMQKVTGIKAGVYEGLVLMNGNPLRNGGSGGAWHVDGYVVGNNSCCTDSEPAILWSPLYDGYVLDLLRHAQNRCQ
jgi:hypothetical protein